MQDPDPTADIADETTSEFAGVAASVVAAHAVQANVATESEAATGDLPVAGTVLRDRYVLEELLGSGGTALVFRASDLRRDAAAGGGHPLAVKLLRPERRGESRSIVRLQREFHQTQAAAHPNVVRIHDLDCDHGTWFIVMELLTGDTLAAQLRRTAPVGLPAKQALAVAAGVAEALAHAHSLGVIHGDVKPANIFMTDAGEIKLFDFGVAPGAYGPPEPTAGTRAYASPQVLGGEQAEAGDDVFSLACVTCEMLTGVRPYGRGGADAKVTAGALPQQPAGVDDSSWKMLARALHLRRSMRPGMKEFAGALRGADAPAQSGVAPVATVLAAPIAVPAVTPAAPARRRRPLTVGALAVGLMLLGILIGRIGPGVESVQSVSPPAYPIEAAEASGTPESALAPATVTAAPTPRTQDVRESAPEETPPIPPASTGLVTFDLPSMVVSNRAVVAAIPLRHLSATRRNVSVNWRIIEGSARPGRDYGGPESGVETFVAGNNFRILYVPILANPATTRDRTFVVELTKATPGADVGGAPRVAVTILGDG